MYTYIHPGREGGGFSIYSISTVLLYVLLAVFNAAESETTEAGTLICPHVRTAGVVVAFVYLTFATDAAIL